jgi:hypothetical protein
MTTKPNRKEGMICPLKMVNPAYPYPFLSQMCEMEKCAWWSTTRQTRPERGGCAILAIADALDEMVLSGLPVRKGE